ncbi:MAG: cell division protein ZipA [Oceanicoccus sp.]|jgi:cell division protein ZipA
MEMGIRDWMIIIGVLLIFAVLLDGFRRMRNERRGKIRMSLNKQFINADGGDDDFRSELPNGGARVVGRGLEQDEILPPLGESLSAAELDLDQSVPILMDSVEDLDVPSEDEIPDVLMHPASDMPVSAEPANTHKGSVGKDQEEVVVINVIAPKGQPFKGPDLLHILLACDLRFGDMNIFHRHEQANGGGAIQFSMANSVEPGFFDLDAIDDFTTPGVCFFMSVPGPQEPIKAFEFMVETAQCLVTNLSADLLDESRSAMTNQTLEHCRQRLLDFERRQLTNA